MQQPTIKPTIKPIQQNRQEVREALLFHGLFFVLTIPVAAMLRGFELGLWRLVCFGWGKAN